MENGNLPARDKDFAKGTLEKELFIWSVKKEPKIWSVKIEGEFHAPFLLLEGHR